MPLKRCESVWMKRVPKAVTYSNIVGIGTDIVDIRRIEKLVAKTGWDKFAGKILSKEEIEALKPKQKNDASHIAKRFAGKEAISKAMGTGIGELGFEDIIISNNSKGKPEATLRKVTNVKIHISMSDEYPYAIAFAVIEQVPD